MALGVSRKISAASARSHTRKTKKSSSFQLPEGILKKLLAILLVGIFAWAYQAARPLPPKICGSPDGPPVTAPRIKLSDGRHLAYKEHGIRKEKAKYKIVYAHGFDSCRHDVAVADNLSPELFEELGVYIVSFDRPGYGESDPNLNGSPKSIALDIEELADQLGLGSKFYAVGFSMGGQVIWGCLKYIPHRLDGAALIAPVVNYWWSGLPADMSKEAYYQQFTEDQWNLRIAHYTPWLTYWWYTQTWFPSSSVASRKPEIFSRQDKELIHKFEQRLNYSAQVRQQGEYATIHQDTIVGFGKWEFCPTELENPFPSNEGSFHLWHGDEDLIVPVTLQRYIAQQLPWLKYHELPGAGHLFPQADGMSDAIIKKLVVGEK